MNNNLQPENKIIELICDYTGFHPESIKPDNLLVDDLGLDSLDVMSLQCELNKFYDIVIEDSEMEQLKTVNDLTQLVLRKANPIE